MKTTDGGVNWNMQNSGTTKNLYAIDFSSALNGIAVGDTGAFLRTINGGATWTPIFVSSTISFRNVYFFNSNIGFVTGSISGVSGHIFKTTDSGATWNPLNINSGNGIYGLTFTSADVGYCSNYYGEIFTTDDGGFTWSQVPSGVTSVISDLYFNSPSAGLGIGANGVIIQTTDSGSSWTPLSSGIFDWLSGIDFYNSMDGFITGGNVSANTGVILQTTDGGINWAPYPTSTHRLLGVDFADSVGFTVGLNGTIMKHAVNVGVHENNFENNIRAYPNPVFNELTLSWDIFKRNENDISLYDETGRLVFQNCFASADGQIQLPVENLSAGNYYLVVSQGEILCVKKIIKARE